jgi:calcyclin binding protein
MSIKWIDRFLEAKYNLLFFFFSTYGIHNVPVTISVSELSANLQNIDNTNQRTMSSAELEEVDMLIADATFPGIKDCLNAYKAKLLASAVPKLPAPVRPAASSKPSGGGAVSTGTVSSSQSFIQITDFAWDQGEYSSTTVTVYVELPGVGGVKDAVKCDFTAGSFDLTVCGLDGKSYRLFRDNLDKDINPSTSKFIVKRDKVVVKLAKAKQEFWSNLTSKKSKEKKESEQKDPSAGLMDMMKDMYNDGDENMKRIIGEAMMKAQRGEKTDPASAMDM